MFAILYTGEIRTIDTVIDTFIKNVLVGENYHVHAVLQSTISTISPTEITTVPTTPPTDIIYKIGSNLKSLQWFDPLDNTWLYIRSHLAFNMNLNHLWYEYLVNQSGSMVEYYQMYWAFLQMIEYEKKYNIKYDYVLRIRCDCVITRPLNYDWIHYTKEQIDDKLALCGNSTKLFMNSLLDNDRYLIKEDVDFTGNNDKDVHQLLQDNNFLITLRENVFYFGSRKVFDALHKLGINYGCLRSDHEYCYDSESQLKLFCAYYGINIYNSSTTKECKSLYEYKEDNYYKDNQLMDQPDVLFFLKRT